MVHRVFVEENYLCWYSFLCRVGPNSVISIRATSEPVHDNYPRQIDGIHWPYTQQTLFIQRVPDFIRRSSYAFVLRCSAWCETLREVWVVRGFLDFLDYYDQCVLCSQNLGHSISLNPLEGLQLLEVPVVWGQTSTFLLSVLSESLDASENFRVPRSLQKGAPLRCLPSDPPLLRRTFLPLWVMWHRYLRWLLFEKAPLLPGVENNFSEQKKTSLKEKRRS